MAYLTPKDDKPTNYQYGYTHTRDYDDDIPMRIECNDVVKIIDDKIIDEVYEAHDQEIDLEEDDKYNLYMVIKGAFKNIKNPYVVVENPEGKRKTVQASELILICNRHAIYDGSAQFCDYHRMFST